MYSDKLGARPVSIDKPTLRALSEKAWESLVERARRGVERGRETLYDELKADLGFLQLESIFIGEAEVEIYLRVMKDKPRSKGVFDNGDKSITVNIEDKPNTAFLNPVMLKYTKLDRVLRKHIYSTLIHEATHAYDRLLYDKQGVGVEPSERNIKDYFNSRGEVKAYTQQISDEAEGYLRDTYGSLTRDTIRDHFQEVFRIGGSKWAEISHLLTPKTKDYIKRAVLGHLLDVAEEDIMARFASNRFAGLIRPPEDLIDHMTTIAEGAVARWALAQQLKSGRFEDNDIEPMRWIEEAMTELPNSVKRGDTSLEEIKNIFRFSIETLDETAKKHLEGRLKSEVLEMARELKDTDPQLVLNYDADTIREVRRISALIANTLAYMEGNRKADVINPYAIDDYREKRDVVFKSPDAYGKYRERGDTVWFVYHDSLIRKIIFKVSIFKNPSSNGSYLWDGQDHTVVLFVDSSKEYGWNLRDFVRLRNTIRHELVHVMQKEYAIKADLRDSEGKLEEGGLPFSKRDQRFTQRMKDKEEELKQIAREEGVDAGFISVHALDDIEFYSRLLDEIADFKSWFKEYKAWHTNEVDNEDIKNHLKYSQFFISLKRHKRESWKKAIGLFVEAVQSP